MTQPRVSAILPAYNVVSYVAATIRSLAAQDWPEIELIAVDDGSTDGTSGVLEREVEAFRGSGRTAQIVTQANAGLAAARNTALTHATGDLVLYVDGDDLLDPTAVTELVAALDADPSARIIFPRCRHIDQAGRELDVISALPPGAVSGADLVIDNPIHTDTGLLMRRDVAHVAGRFNTDLRACIGLDFWVRAASGGGDCILPLDRVLVSYRRRTGQITSDWQRQKTGWETVASRAAETGLLDDETLRAAGAHNRITWATTAYRAAQYSDARRLMREALRLDPKATLGDAHGRIRLLSTLATYLPSHLHDRIAGAVRSVPEK